MGDEENPTWGQTNRLSQVVDIDLNLQGHEEFSRTKRGFWVKGLTYVNAKVIKKLTTICHTFYSRLIQCLHHLP